MSIELRNINGNCADIVEKETGATIISNWIFQSAPTNTMKKEITIAKIIKLKEAGFESGEIIKILKDLDIE